MDKSSKIGIITNGEEGAQKSLRNFMFKEDQPNEYILRSVLTDAPTLINPSNENIEKGLNFLLALNEQLRDVNISDTISFLQYEYDLLKSMRAAEEKNRNEFVSTRAEHYKDFHLKSREEIEKRFDDWSNAIKANIKATDAELLYRDHYRTVIKEIQERFVVQKQKPNRVKELPPNS